MSNPNKIILILLGAAAAGVVVGILLSPDKGGEVRKQIANKASDIASFFGEIINTGKEKLQDAGEKVANKSKSFSEEVTSS